MATYSGPVAFGSDGVHYPVVDNPDDIDPDTGQPRTHIDPSRPLRWIEGDTGSLPCFSVNRSITTAIEVNPQGFVTGRHQLAQRLRQPLDFHS